MKILKQSNPLFSLLPKWSLIRSFWSLERAWPWARTFIWKLFYNLFSRLFPDDDIQFMNWGYVPLEGEPHLEIGDVAEYARTPIQLYAYTLGEYPSAQDDVLEVGSGRGGGAAWIANYLHPRSVTGVELAPEAVRLAKRLHAQVDSLRFLPGDAHELPIEDASIDIVVNVESCHHYASMETFLQEVHRVLRPGGKLVLSDYREGHEMPELESAFRQSDMDLVEAREITANVLAALDRDNDYKEALVRERVPWPLRRIIRTFAGNRGTDVYNGFAQNDWTYWRYLLKKGTEGK